MKASLGPARIEERYVTEGGRRFARSLLCLIAPLIAGLALVFTNGVTQSFALPVACGLLMCLDLGFSILIENQSYAGLGTVLATLSLATFVLAGGLVHQLVARQHAIVMPALARA